MLQAAQAAAPIAGRIKLVSSIRPSLFQERGCGLTVLDDGTSNVLRGAPHGVDEMSANVTAVRVEVAFACTELEGGYGEDGSNRNSKDSVSCKPRLTS